MRERDLEAPKTVKTVGDFLDAFCYVTPKDLMKFVANFAIGKREVKLI